MPDELFFDRKHYRRLLYNRFQFLCGGHTNLQQFIHTYKAVFENVDNTPVAFYNDVEQAIESIDFMYIILIRKK